MKRTLILIVFIIACGTYPMAEDNENNRAIPDLDPMMAQLYPDLAAPPVTEGMAPPPGATQEVIDKLDAAPDVQGGQVMIIDQKGTLQYAIPRGLRVSNSVSGIAPGSSRVVQSSNRIRQENYFFIKSFHIYVDMTSGALSFIQTPLFTMCITVDRRPIYVLTKDFQDLNNAQADYTIKNEHLNYVAPPGSVINVYTAVSYLGGVAGSRLAIKGYVEGYYRPLSVQMGEAEGVALLWPEMAAILANYGNF